MILSDRLRHVSRQWFAACVIMLTVGMVIKSKTCLLDNSLLYGYHIINMVWTDSVHRQKAYEVSTATEWELHQLQMDHFNKSCPVAGPQAEINSKSAWITIVINDAFIYPILVLGHLLNRLSCYQKIVLVSGEVSESHIKMMIKVGFKVHVVTPFDCDWLQKHHGSTGGGIPGTHTRFHLWNMVEYNTLVYVDADLMPILSMDELFDIKSDFSAAYCEEPGIVDPCFNAGLMVVKPSQQVFREIMDIWTSAAVKTCNNDQVVLWHQFADKGNLNLLPYGYNVRRHMYHPMKAFHFACCLHPKPWKESKVPTEEEAGKFSRPLLHYDDIVLYWWKYIYEAVRMYNLQDWWRNGGTLEGVQA